MFYSGMKEQRFDELFVDTESHPLQTRRESNNFVNIGLFDDPIKKNTNKPFIGLSEASSGNRGREKET